MAIKADDVTAPRDAAIESPEIEWQERRGGYFKVQYWAGIRLDCVSYSRRVAQSLLEVAAMFRRAT